MRNEQVVPATLLAEPQSLAINQNLWTLGMSFTNLTLLVILSAVTKVIHAPVH